MVFLLSLILIGHSSFFFLCLKITCSVFLSEILSAFSKLVKFLMSILKYLLSLFTDYLKGTRLASGLVTLQDFITWWRLLIYIKNKIDPKSEPCGHLFYSSFIRYMTINRSKLFSVKEVGYKPFICDTAYVIMFKLCLQDTCSASSKAFCKSKKIPQPMLPLSNFFLISSVRLIKAWKVKCCCLKPNWSR